MVPPNRLSMTNTKKTIREALVGGRVDKKNKE
jgi:hypothetical protein